MSKKEIQVEQYLVPETVVINVMMGGLLMQSQNENPGLNPGGGD